MENSMAVILKNVIMGGGMPLAHVSERIETMYLSGRINAEERLELTELMHEKASPENEKGGWEEMYRALAEKYRELEARVEALETVGGEEEGEGTNAEIPQWQAWDGVNGGYAQGDVVMHEDRFYVSGYTGAVNVWEPGALGVDERYWREITEEEAIRLMGE